MSREASKPGKCHVCGYSVRLRIMGAPERHTLYAGSRRYTCPGGESFRAGSPDPIYPLATWLLDRHLPTKAVA